MLEYKSHLRKLEFKNNGEPKHVQLAWAIAEDINGGKLTFGDWLPSINDHASYNKISRATVIKAYEILKERGVIGLNLSNRYMVKNAQVAMLMLLITE